MKGTRQRAGAERGKGPHGYPMDLKLTIDTVPRDTRGKNLRKALYRKDWETIRQGAIKAHGRKCHICGYRGKGIEVHEVWNFDYGRRVQSLVDFIPLCHLCHLVKHLGVAWELGKQGRVDFNRVARHFLKVNGCTTREFNDYLREVERIQQEKDAHFWTITVKYPGWEWVTFPR